MRTLTLIYQFIVAHDLIAAYILAVMIDQLPTPSPSPTSYLSNFYKWFFGVVQILAANWTRGKRGVQGTLAAKP